MFETMLRRRELRQLMNRLETARLRKERVMEAFITGRPVSPVIAQSSNWSRKMSEQPDAMHVADAIDEVARLETELQECKDEMEELEV